MAQKSKKAKRVQSFSKRWNQSQIVLAVLALAVMGMAIGFALFTQTLNINGSVKVDASKWSVHFVTDSYQESPGSVAASAHNITETTATYTAELQKPGDFYEFTANVINDGTFNATLKSLTMTALTTAQSKYLTYEFNYAGSIYSTSQTGLNFSLPYATGSNIKPVKVKVSYVMPSDPADLPQSDVTVTLSATLNYEQSN